MLTGNPDVASWSTYVGRGAIRFYLPLDVNLNNDFFSQAVVVAKDVTARERLHAMLERKLAEELPSVVARVSPLRARTARRLAGAIPREWPRSCDGTIDCAADWASYGRRSQVAAG